MNKTIVFTMNKTIVVTMNKTRVVTMNKTQFPNLNLEGGGGYTKLTNTNPQDTNARNTASKIFMSFPLGMYKDVFYFMYCWMYAFC